MQYRRCPECRSAPQGTLVTCLKVSLAEWPTLLIAAGLTMVFGQLLMLSPLVTAIFAVVAALPFTLDVERRARCTLCGQIDSMGEAPKTRTDSLR